MTLEVSIGGGDDWMDVYLSNERFDHDPPDSPGNVGFCRICGGPTVAVKISGEWRKFHQVGKPSSEDD